MSSRILPKFELFMPESIQAVVDCLQKYKDKAAVMAGGTDLMVRMKSGIAPEVVVSLARVKGLDDLSYDDQDGLTIGATTTINQVLAFDNIQTLYPALFASAKENGTVQTRQVATVLGNLLNASPAADCACAVLALGGHVLLQGPEGTRKVAIDEFWTGYRRTARKPDELALKLVIYPPGKSGSAFRALTRTQKDLSKINAAAAIAVENGVCFKARLAMGAVAPTLIRLKKCEALMEGNPLDDTLLEKVAAMVPEEIRPIDDVRSSGEYRKSVSGILMKSVIQSALG